MRRDSAPCDLKASGSRITERVGGGISALEPDLVRPFALEWDEEVGSDRKPAVRINVHLRDPSANSLRIELRVDGGIERVCHVNAAAVAAHFEHLRGAVESATLRMRRVRHDPAETHLAGELRGERIAHVALNKVAGAPACRVEEAGVETQADFRNQRKY